MKEVMFVVADAVQFAGGEVRLSVPWAEATELLEALRLEATGFGFVGATELAALCRRCLWPSRHVTPTTRAWAAQLLLLTDCAPEGGMILYS